MAIHLYNHTAIPTAELRAVLTWAARKVGVPGDVAVKVTPSRGYVSGEANSGWPYLDWLRCHAGKTRTDRQTMHRAGPGYVSLSLPDTPPPYLDAGRAASWVVAHSIRIVSLCLHELAHVRQTRTRLVLRTPRTSSGRRVAWAKRAEEIDAENAIYDTFRVPANARRADDLAEALALAWDAAIRTRTPAERRLAP